MKIFTSIFPPYLLALIFFVQIVLILLNYEVYDSRELLIYFSWIPILQLPFLIFRNNFFYQITIVLFFLEGLLNLIHIAIINGPITASSLFIISNSNFSEASEFIQLKLNPMLFLLIPYIGLFTLAVRNVPQITTLQQRSRYLIVVIYLISILFFVENIFNGRFVRKGTPQTVKALISFVDEQKTFNSLKKRTVLKLDARQNPASSQKQIFVLIIGESCNRNHMSAYGYHKITNPLLSKRNDIIIYSNVVSAYSNTLSSVLAMMTESNLENKIKIDEAVSLIDVFHSAGFKTIWISNQSPIGVWDNAVYNLAQTADIKLFVNKKSNSSFESTYIPSFDEDLLQPFQSALNTEKSNLFVVIHLMGSHTNYNKRYPAAFESFNDHSTGQKKIISEYDNSILYNDFIVDSLFSILHYYSIKHENEILSSVYLADHGENVYDESGSAGHSYAGLIPKSNVEIPFIVWTSKRFRDGDENKFSLVAKNKDLPFISDDLFHAIIDLNNIDGSFFSGSKSIFNLQYNAGRKRILEDNADYDLK